MENEMSLEERILSHRVAELGVQEKIVQELKNPEIASVWRSAGCRNLRDYCESTLSYSPLATRELLVRVGHILTRDSMRSDDDSTNVRIKQLIAWRTRAASHLRVPAYRILSNRTLLAVAKANPDTLELLEKIDGIGHVKIRSFGIEILKTLETATHASAASHSTQSLANS